MKGDRNCCIVSHVRDQLCPKLLALPPASSPHCCAAAPTTLLPPLRCPSGRGHPCLDAGPVLPAVRILYMTLCDKKLRGSESARPAARSTSHGALARLRKVAPWSEGGRDHSHASGLVQASRLLVDGVVLLRLWHEEAAHAVGQVTGASKSPRAKAATGRAAPSSEVHRGSCASSLSTAGATQCRTSRSEVRPHRKASPCHSLGMLVES